MSTERKQSLTLQVFDPDSTRTLLYSIQSGTVTMSETWSPYFQANLTVMLPVGPNTPNPVPVGSSVPNLIANYTLGTNTTGWTAGYTDATANPTAAVQFTAGQDPFDPTDTDPSWGGIVMLTNAGTGTVDSLWLQTTVATTVGQTYTVLTPGFSAEVADPDAFYDFYVYVNGVQQEEYADTTFVATTTTTTIRYSLECPNLAVDDFIQLYGEAVGVYEADWDNPTPADPQIGSYFWSADINADDPFDPVVVEPYATAQLYFQGLPNLAEQEIDTQLLTDLDPRNDLEAYLECDMYEFDSTTGELTGQSTISSNLSIESRVVDWVNGTVQLLLTTNEFTLQKDGNKTTSAISFRAHQSSLIAVVNDVLAAAGLTDTLDASSLDADVTTTSTITNYFPNPNSIGTAWVTGSSSTTTTSVSTSAGAVAGTQRTVATTAAAATAVVYLGGLDGTTATNIACSPGDTVYAFVYVDPLTIARNATITIRLMNSAGTTLLNSTSAAVSCPTAAFTKIAQSVTIPAGETVSVTCYASIAGGTGSTQVHLSGAFLTINNPTGAFETNGTTALGYFAGTTAANTYYTYSWDGTANASSSTRHPTTAHQASVDSLTLSPGQTYFDMLNPVVQAAGRRLFQDEAGVWRLVNGTTYTQAGTVSIVPTNTTQLQDSIDLSDSADNFNSVVVKYTYLDKSGNTETSYDAAGTSGPINLIELDNTPYPGAGRAAYELAKGQGRGRVMNPTAMTDFSVRPSMAVDITAPYTIEQSGYVQTVAWDVASAEMTVTARQLTDTTPSS